MEGEILGGIRSSILRIDTNKHLEIITWKNSISSWFRGVVEVEISGEGELDWVNIICSRPPKGFKD